MSTFAQLVTAVAQRCLVGDVTDVLGQAGDAARVVRNVRDAWTEIQQLSDDWLWMRSQFSFATVAGQAAYAPAYATGVVGGGVRKWRSHEQSFRVYTTALARRDECFLVEWDWASYEDTYGFGAPVQGKPSVFAIRNDKSIALGSVPSDAALTVRGWYQRESQILADSSDEPAMPSEYHTLIEHLATMKYAVGDNAPELFSEAQSNYNTMLANLKRTQLPEMTFGGPLA